MGIKKYSQKAVILHKRLSKDLDSGDSISAKKCNNYIGDIESLKDQLYDANCDWVEEYEALEDVEEPNMFSDGAEDDEVVETLEEAREQVERILGELGVDATAAQMIPAQNQGSSVTIINSPTMTQHTDVNASATMNIQIEISRLETEFEREAGKMLPDRTKLQKIVDKLKVLGPVAMPVAQKLAERLAGVLF